MPRWPDRKSSRNGVHLRGRTSPDETRAELWSPAGKMPVVGETAFVELPAEAASLSGREAGRTHDNTGMDAGELVTSILGAIGSDRDLYLYDHYIIGPDARQRAREVLIEKRGACTDPDEVAFLTSAIQGLEEGRG
jgi:hypothetical protein